jgi:hypothetical protein
MFAASAFAAPVVVTRISFDTVPTTFVPTGGAHGLGTITFAQTTPVEIDFSDGTTNVINDGLISLAVSLLTDNSIGGLAKGFFDSGAFTIKDNLNNVLLNGSVDWLRMSEVIDGAGYMSGDASLTVTGGSLKPIFGDAADMYDVTFRVNPKTISNFSNSFAGESDFTIMPIIPEPASIMLIGGAFALVAGAVRKRLA